MMLREFLEVEIMKIEIEKLVQLNATVFAQDGDIYSVPSALANA